MTTEEKTKTTITMTKEYLDTIDDAIEWASEVIVDQDLTHVKVTIEPFRVWEEQHMQPPKRGVIYKVYIEGTKEE